MIGKLFVRGGLRYRSRAKADPRRHDAVVITAAVTADNDAAARRQASISRTLRVAPKRSAAISIRRRLVTRKRSGKIVINASLAGMRLVGTPTILLIVDGAHK